MYSPPIDTHIILLVLMHYTPIVPDSTHGRYLHQSAIYPPVFL